MVTKRNCGKKHLLYKIKIEMKIGDMYKQLGDQKGKYGRSRDKNRSLPRATTYSSKQQALEKHI